MRRVLVIAVLTMVALSGCAAKSTHQGVASVAQTAKANASPTPSLSDEEKQVKFAECMRQHGVEVDDPQNGGPSAGSGGLRVNPSTAANMQKAMQACQQYLPGGVLPTPGASQMDAMRAYAKCMREHGVNMPDPDPNGGGAIVQSGSADDGTDTNPDSQQFKDANSACQHLLPGNVHIGVSQ
jgi:hypothetical protein